MITSDRGWSTAQGHSEVGRKRDRDKDGQRQRETHAETVLIRNQTSVGRQLLWEVVGQIQV